MGFTKRHITKDLILSNLNDIDRLLSVDVLSMDLWVSNFVADLSKQQRNLRKQVISENESTLNHHVLDSIAEAIINLKTNPNQVDIEIIKHKLNLNDLDSDIDFDQKVQTAFDQAIKYYDKLLKY